MPPVTSIVAAHLTSILGSEFVREENDAITATPADTQQISALLSYANQHNLTIEIIGAGTKRSWGNPVTANILLDTTRLNRVLEHPWQDLTCTVQAGCTWSAMQQTLAQHNQFVALDPLWPHRATVGGIVSTNDSGALRHRYGSLRDLIIGMTIVLADGTIAKSGGKVVKNVAGYDLHKLMTGAFGTLGIIAEVTFRLHPLPLHAQTFTVSAPQAAQLAPLMAAIRDSHLLTQALQLRGNSQGFHLDIQLNAHPDAKQPKLLQSLVEATRCENENGASRPWSSSALQPADLAPNPESGFSPGSPANIGQAREQLCGCKDSIIAKISVLPSTVPYLSDEIVEENLEVVAQAGGTIYAAVPLKASYEYRYTLTTLSDLQRKIDTHNGAIVLHGVSSVLLELLKSWPSLCLGLTTSSALPLMQAIKHQFDPNRILNPGRFLGGI